MDRGVRHLVIANRAAKDDDPVTGTASSCNLDLSMLEHSTLRGAPRRSVSRHGRRPDGASGADAARTGRADPGNCRLSGGSPAVWIGALPHLPVPAPADRDLGVTRRTKSAVLEVSGVQWASSKSVVESVLSRRPGVVSVEANPVAQTANVAFDPDQTSVAGLAAWIRDCGYHCGGRSVPEHLCDPMADPTDFDQGRSQRTGAHAPDEHSEREAPTAREGHAAHAGHGTVTDAQHAPDEHAEPEGRTPQDVMGHGGHGVGMSMDAMVRDMRNRFLVAAVLSVPITLWSPIGRDVLGFSAEAPFGLRDDVFSLLLSLPVVFYSAWIFFDGAYRALRARTLDMMVLVAIAVGAGWLYSLGVTLSGGGEVFYEAATVLTAFVLLGHWFEMRARGGANDAIRTLLELAPPKAVVLRDGEPVEVPTAEVQVGDLLLIRPGRRSRWMASSRRASRRSTSPWSPARACRSPRARARRSSAAR